MASTGIYFDLGNGQGRCLLLTREAVQFGEIKADMMELYVNDYLMNLKRMNCNGQIGFIGADNTTAFNHIKVWQSN